MPTRRYFKFPLLDKTRLWKNLASNLARKSRGIAKYKANIFTFLSRHNKVVVAASEKQADNYSKKKLYSAGTIDIGTLYKRNRRRAAFCLYVMTF